MSDHEPTVTFHYVKSNFFRVIHTDGVIGGITPQGLLHVTLFSERPSLPDSIEYKLLVRGTVAGLGDEVRRNEDAGVVREVEAALLMSSSMAKRLHDWLGARLKEFGPENESLPPAPTPEEGAGAK